MFAHRHHHSSTQLLVASIPSVTNDGWRGFSSAQFVALLTKHRNILQPKYKTIQLRQNNSQQIKWSPHSKQGTSASMLRKKRKYLGFVNLCLGTLYNFQCFVFKLLSSPFTLVLLVLHSCLTNSTTLTPLT